MQATRTLVRAPRTLLQQPFIYRRNFCTAAQEVAQYAHPLRVTHWAMGAGVLACFGLIEVKKRQPKGSAMIGSLMWWHKSIGVLLGGLVCYRLALRLTTRLPADLPGPAWMHYGAMAGHYGLYGFMIFMPLTGIMMGYFGGKGLPFFFFTIPGKKTPRGDIAKPSYQWHKKVGWIFEALVAVHVGAAFAHQFMGHSNIWNRITPFAGASMMAMYEDDEDEDSLLV